MHSAVSDDRLWFKLNPEAIVRFRHYVIGEFDALLNIGEQPPVFRPSICRPNAPLNSVAVVDLIRLAGESDEDPSAPTARLRLRIPKILRPHRQQHAKKELLRSVASELLQCIENNEAGKVA